MPQMSFAEYARHRGVSKAAVSYAVRDGRITPTTNHSGKRCIDSDVADQQWNANTAHEKRRNTGDSVPGVAPINAAAQPASVDSTPPPESPTVQIGFDTKALGIPDKPDVSGDGADNTYARARANKEHYLAKQAELDYEKAAGRLVEVSTIIKEWNSIANRVRSKVLGIPSKIKQRLPDLTASDYLILENIVRESLEDLATKGSADDDQG